MPSRQVLLGIAALALALTITPWLIVNARHSAAPAKLAPFVTTPQPVVERMLELAQVGPHDVVYDLGSGDGRLVITAAKKYGAHGVDVDFDPQLVLESRANAKQAGVEDLVEFRDQDARTVDVSPATVVTLYLLNSSNLELRAMLTRQLKPGARIVSHKFGMGDWQPEKTEIVPNTDSTIYLWRADGRVRP
jgi:cyclopropane fatty-acyl-phospholipid synthase-like methyltransferase